MCIYIIEWTEWEWREYYILENPECPSEKEFEEDVANAMRQVATELLRMQNEKPIDMRTLVEKTIEKMPQYRRVKIRGEIQLCTTMEHVFMCLYGRENIRILGEDLCRRIHEHNMRFDEQCCLE